MMKYIFCLVIILSIISCSNSSAIRKQLSGSDSVVINFNKPQTNIIDKTVTTTESKAIEKLSRFVDSKTSEAYKCGYDGNIQFFSSGQLVGDVAFNYSGEGCHHFILMVGEELTPTSMNNEAVDFLKSLAEGKGWY